MANVTYLLGSGASANSLPTYLNFSNRFEKFKNIFLENSFWVKKLTDSQKADANRIKTIAERIALEFRFHNTPDTIAKKYFHSNNESSELEDLKNILILFFLYEQTLDETIMGIEPGTPEFKQPIDKRYDAFIASLLEPVRGKLKLYNQFKILTWNYDLQFEIAYSRYNNNQLIPNCQGFIQSCPTLLPVGNEKFSLDKFSVLHLNGIAYARPNSTYGSKELLGSFYDRTSMPIGYLTDVYHSLISRGISDDIGGSKLLSFAWEKQDKEGNKIESEILKKAIEVARQTQILVIIGYSFPIFNNHIDKKLLGEMGQLQKVYIQSPKAKEIENILTDFSIPPGKIKDVGYFSQFHIPIEWDKTY